MVHKKNRFIPSDLSESLWRLSEEAFEFGSPWTQRQFLQDLGQETSHYFIEWETELRGFVNYHLMIDEAEIVNLAIDSRYQNQGVAFRLLETLEAELRERAVRSLFLEVRKSNIAAQKLYQKYGFKETGRRKKYYRNPPEEAILMCLEIL